MRFIFVWLRKISFLDARLSTVQNGGFMEELMKSLFKKAVSALVFSLALILTANAVPGMIQYIPDFSGEYVYYSDKSFTRTSIVGFLFYDEGTYAVRYYAPADVKNGLLEKDITLYISVNPDSPSLEMTGEKTVGVSSQEDYDICNYLHDLIYEFSARAQKAFLEGIDKIESRQEFPQFGGNVTIVFSTQVPIFNIDSIRASDGSTIMSVQTVGALVSSGDTSFTSYKGVEGLPKDRQDRSFKNKSRSKKITANFEKQSISIDAQWSKSMENLWLLGDYALLTLNTVPLPESYAGKEVLFRDTLIRKLSQSTSGSYILWPHKNMSLQGNTVRMTNIFFQPDSGDVTRDFKILTKMSDGSYSYLTLTVFDSVYQKNKKYFDGILASYKVK